MFAFRTPLTAGLLAGGLLAGCTIGENYPPALPVAEEYRSPSPVEIPAPPPPPVAEHPAVRLLPTEEEWAFWTPYTPPLPKVCTGKGKKRRCMTPTKTAVDDANAGAMMKPTTQHTAHGTSAQTTYPFDRQKARIYEVHTSPDEATYLLLPQDERLAAKVLLNPEAWEVTYGTSGAEGARREVVALRPVQAPQTARALLVLQSGLTIHVKLLAMRRPGMLSVTWDIPALVSVTMQPLPLDQRPPQFDAQQVYSEYTLESDSHPTRVPPWLPEIVLDDGTNTLLRFRGMLEGIRMPVISGVQQNGRLALVHSRWYVRPEHGAWLYVQGLWPALQLTDAQGLSVRVVRQGPPVTVAERSP
jgi:type IV secretory pathway VirB9-like protein